MVHEIRLSTTFDAWLANLNDSNARARIAARIDRLAMGNPGDVKPVGGGVSEMRINYARDTVSITHERTELCTCCSVAVLSPRRTRISEVLER